MKNHPPVFGNLTRECMECNSLYYAPTSLSKEVCPECAHYLFGKEPCVHIFENNRCKICFWDGSTTDRIEQLKIKNN